MKHNKDMIAQEAAIKRQQILDDADAMKRLSAMPEFIRYCELLEAEKKGINAMLLDRNCFSERTNDEKNIMIARINQIDSDIKKPRSLIWQMENLTEVRGAIKEQTCDRQTVGNKTGG